VTTNRGLLDALDQRIRALRQEARDTEAARNYIEGVLEASAAAVRVSGERLPMNNDINQERSSIRDELDRLYKNLIVLSSRVGRLIEEERISAGVQHGDAFRALYSEWKQAGSYGSFYRDHIAKAIRSIDPEWSQAWANYAALLVLEPGEKHSPPVIGPGTRPSNAF